MKFEVTYLKLDKLKLIRKEVVFMSEEKKEEKKERKVTNQGMMARKGGIGTNPDITSAEMMEEERSGPAYIQCICTGECPGFSDLLEDEGAGLFQIINTLRENDPIAFATIHPQLCTPDGEAFWLALAKKGQKFVVGACDPRMQWRLFKPAFDKAGVDVKESLYGFDARMQSAESVIEKARTAINKALEDMKAGK